MLQLITNCRSCGIRFITDPRNAGRNDLRCPFGCREAHRKQQSTKRSVDYYQSEAGKQKKRIQNAKRKKHAEDDRTQEAGPADVAEPGQRAQPAEPSAPPAGPADVAEPSQRAQPAEPSAPPAGPADVAEPGQWAESAQPAEPGAPPGAPPEPEPTKALQENAACADSDDGDGDAQLLAKRVVTQIAESPIVEYVRMMTSLLEGRRVRRDEILAMLTRVLRQHTIAHRRRIDYVVEKLNQHPT